MPIATIEEVQAHLPELLVSLRDNEKLVITRDSKPVAYLTGGPPKGTLILDRGKGLLISYIDDDEHLKDFEACKA